jgi:membrane fusion protein, copper/silver efflux system
MNPSDEQEALPEGGQEPVAQTKTDAPPPEPPKKKEGHGVRNSLFIILLIITLGEAAYIFREQLKGSVKPESQTGAATSERKILYWQDPMHPQYTSDKPGTAPDCGMDLVPVYADEVKPTAAPGERKILYWMDAMNPDHHYDKPGKAPDGMDLVPVYADENAADKTLSEGAFRITPEKQQLIGVQYGEVSLQPLTKTIRAVATLTYDETKIARIHAKIEGWIDKVFIDFTGQLVKMGQPLLAVYSPELVATQEEYLLALRAKDKLGSSSFKEVADGAGSLFDAARKRLQLWDVSDEQIAEIEKTKEPIKNLMLYSPVNGFVTARNSYEKQRITPDTELYAIADLSTIWAIVDFYEYEANDVRLGQGVVLAIASFPGRTFRGKVTYIYPQLDNSTRTLRVRVELPNPDFKLKPEMYANAELKIDYGRRLAIPQEAVLDSGSEQLVFIALDGGYLEPRKVQLGDKIDDRVIVLGGLKAGEKIVTSGNFLIDSESRLKSAAKGMGMPEMQQGTESQKQSQQPTSRTNSQSAPADHSMHMRGMEEPEKEEPMDHSNHAMEPENSRHD